MHIGCAVMRVRPRRLARLADSFIQKYLHLSTASGVTQSIKPWLVGKMPIAPPSQHVPDDPLPCCKSPGKDEILPLMTFNPVVMLIFTTPLTS